MQSGIKKETVNAQQIASRHVGWWLAVVLVPALCIPGCTALEHAKEIKSSSKDIIDEPRPCHKGRGELQKGKLLVATCQFPISADISANARWIRRQMRQAHNKGANIAQFPECALSGYAGTDQDHENLEFFDWQRQRAELKSILALAKQLKLWVVLGGTHQLSGNNKPHNSLYLIDSGGNIVDRYDKRFCTSIGLQHYSPGDHFVTFDLNGVRCGLLICYDARFPELYRQYYRLGVQLMFHSFYNARQKKTSILSRIIPPTVQTRAATNYMFVSTSNSSAGPAWPSIFITPDGLIQSKCPPNKPAVMVNLVDTAKRYYDASGPYRDSCIQGKYNSGQVVDDPRSANRQSY